MHSAVSLRANIWPPIYLWIAPLIQGVAALECYHCAMGTHCDPSASDNRTWTYTEEFPYCAMLQETPQSPWFRIGRPPKLKWGLFSFVLSRFSGKYPANATVACVSDRDGGKKACICPVNKCNDFMPDSFTSLWQKGQGVIDSAGRVQPTNASVFQRSGRDADLPPDAEGTGNYDYDGESDFFGLLPDSSQGGSGSGVNSAVRKLAVPDATTITAGVVGPDAEGNPNADAEDSSNMWMIIGISVGVVVVVAIAAGVGSYVCCTRRRRRAAAQGGDAASQRSQSRR